MKTIPSILAKPTAAPVALIAIVACLFAAGTAEAQQFGLHVPARNESLRLVRHDLQVTIRHPVAETVLTQEFENPHNTNLEAFFHYPVPPGATVTGLALWVKGERREARMLERQKAREIYDGIVSEKKDPALVEKTASGFRIRIFPILARSRHRVELRFVQPVEHTGEDGYNLTLRRPPGSTVEVLRLGARLEAMSPLNGVRLQGYSDRFQPARGRNGAPHAFVLPMPTTPQSFDQPIRINYRVDGTSMPVAALTHTLKDQQLFVAELPVRGDALSARRVAVLLDCSSSMADHLETARGLTQAVVGRLTPRDELAIVPFGLLPQQEVKLAPVTDRARDRLKEQLESIQPAGGTAFVPAVLDAVASGARHLVLVTDGGTVQHRAELEHLMRRLFDRRSVTVSVLAVGPVHNEEALSDLALVSGGTFERLDAASDLQEIGARVVRQKLRSTPRLVAPAGELHLLRAAGGNLLVVGSVSASIRRATVRIGRHQLAVDLQRGLPTPGIQGLFGAAAVERQMQAIKLFGETDQRREMVMALSKRHHVMSEYTALLATETDAQYLRKTSGGKWQRQTPGAPGVGQDLPPVSFNSTPEPHEWALIGLGMVLLVFARRRGWVRI